MVIQFLKPFMSAHDIAKGARWSTQIASELQESIFGLLCITPDNINSQWMHFEAGALSKTIDSSRVCPLLFGMDNADLSGPISQFQSTLFSKSEMAKLVFTINQSGGEAVAERKLEKVFEALWPDLERKLRPVLERMKQGQPVRKRPAVDWEKMNAHIEEILKEAKDQSRLMASPDRLFPMSYLDYAFKEFQVRQAKLGVSSGWNSRPGKG